MYEWYVTWWTVWFLSTLTDKQIRELTFASVGKINDIPAIPGI